MFFVNNNHLIFETISHIPWDIVWLNYCSNKLIYIKLMTL